MAKASFAKLKLKTDTSIKTINFNDIEIEVKQYLPINETISLIENIINNSATELKFYSPALVHLFYALEIIYNYTNISFTDKQKEEPTKLYDTIVSSGLWNAIEEAIPEDELDFICEALDDTINSVYKYQNSVMGILDTISQDYSTLSLDASEIQKKLNSAEGVEFLKDVMDKLG